MANFTGGNGNDRFTATTSADFFDAGPAPSRCRGTAT